MTDLPRGTVTFLFTDIEGSTRLLQHLGDVYAAVLEEHGRILRGVVETRNGVVIDGGATGDCRASMAERHARARPDGVAYGRADRHERPLRRSRCAGRKLGDRHGVAAALEGFARVAGASARFERSARLFAAAAALREAVGAPIPPVSRAAYDGDLATVRAGLDEATFNAVWGEGEPLFFRPQPDIVLTT